jgi:Rhs element Vgr protein
VPNAGYIHVQIGGEDIDLALLAEVEVRQKLNDHWTARVLFRSTHDTQPDVAQMLGQALTISGYDLLGVEHTLFSGPVRDVELIYEVNGSYGAHIGAISASWLMDQSQRHAYFLKQSPSAIAQTLAANYGLSLKGSIEGDAGLSRVQWSESDWSFLLRLVDDGEAWLRPTQDGLETQTSFQPGPTLEWREGEYGLMEFSGSGHVRPVLQSGAHYDHRAAQSRSYAGVKSEAAFYAPWSGLRGKALSAGESISAATVAERHRATTLDSYQQQLQKESRRQAVNAGICSGISRSPEVMAGNEVTISGLDADVDGTYGVIECLHQWTPRGFENRFRATTARRWFAPERPARPQAEGVFPARVVANHDPQNLGRVQVQFYWQEENATTWARLITSHAGAGRGVLITPEVGDEVAVRFEEADPERPYILGSVWNGVLQPPTSGYWEGGTNGGEFAANNIKRLVTKSGHRVTLVDTSGQETIAMATPKSNRLVMTEKTNETGRPAVVLHTDGDIILAAPKGRIHLQSKLQSKEVGAGGGGVGAGTTTASPPLSTPAIVPAVYQPSSAGAQVMPASAGTGGPGMTAAERAVICKTICECNQSAPLSASGAQLKQQCVSAKLEAMDAASGHRSTIKSEVSYNMTTEPPTPIMVNDNSTRPHPWNKYPGQKVPDFIPGKGMMRRPDAVIVNNPNLPPTQDNLRSVVEIKFPPQPLDREQDDEYRRIAGSNAQLEHLSPQECGCPEKQRVPEPQTVPARQPEGQEDHTLRNVAIGVGVGAAVVVGAIVLAPEEAVAAAGYGLLRLGGFLLRGAATAY